MHGAVQISLSLAVRSSITVESKDTNTINMMPSLNPLKLNESEVSVRKHTGYKGWLVCPSVGAVSVWLPTKAVWDKWSEGPRHDSTSAELTITVYLAAY